MEIRKIKKGSWIVEKDGQEVFSGKTKKECNQWIEEQNKPKPKATPKAEPTPKKSTRAKVFNNIMKAGGGTKKSIIEKMIATYGGSKAEADFQTTTFLRLLVTMGYCSKNEDGAFTLTGK